MTLDDALDRIRLHSPEYGPELSDHLPMVVEALDRLGLGSLIARYVDKTLPHRRRMSDEACPALDGFEEAVERIRASIARSGWARAMTEELAPIADGLAGAAFHGTIRIAHAVRALERADTDARRAELANALAYAGARAERLPDTKPAGRLPLADVLARLTPSPHALSRRSGLISVALAERARRHPDLAARFAEVSLPEPRQAADELCATALRMFLESEYLPSNTFTVLHAVTGMEAVRTLVRTCAPLDSALAQALVENAALALSAMRVAFVGAWRDPQHVPDEAARRDGLERAAHSLDDHAIKLAAALEAMPEISSLERARALERWLAQLEG
jgi:hypothetical protein